MVQGGPENKNQITFKITIFEKFLTLEEFRGEERNSLTSFPSSPGSPYGIKEFD